MHSACSRDQSADNEEEEEDDEDVDWALEKEYLRARAFSLLCALLAPLSAPLCSAAVPSAKSGAAEQEV